MKIFEVLKKEKRFIIFFCLLTFWSANTVQIYGGMCTNSPCSGPINASDAAENDQWVEDFSGAWRSNTYLAPLNFLIPDALTIINGLEINEFNQFDRKNEIIKVGPELAKADAKPLLLAFLMIKLITLLNLPMWFLIAILIIKIKQKSKILGAIIFNISVVGFLFNKLLLSLFSYGGNYEYNIWVLIYKYLGF